MKALFTKNFYKAGIICFSLLFFSLSAWTQVFVIFSPESLAGGWTVESTNTADWGGQIPGSDPMQWIGDLEFASDTSSANPTLACNDTSINLANDFTGKIAMIDRGACNFSLKAYNAQKKGAIAVVICNNGPPSTAGMSGGIAASLVTIPVIRVGLDDCATIRAVMETETVNALIAESFTWANDLALVGPSNAANFQTPVAHIQDVVFTGAVTNKGSQAQTNVGFDFRILDGDGTAVFTGPPATIPSMNPDDTIPYPPSFTLTYTPPGCVGDYQMIHSVSSMDVEDDFGSDNETINLFSTSSSTFAKDNMPVSGVANALGGTYEFGNFYELLEADSAISLTFALAKNAADGPLDGESITVLLLSVDCDLNDPACTTGFDDGKVTPIGVGFYTVPTSTANYALLTADLLDFNTFAPGPLPLPAGTYIAFVSITGNGVDNTIFVGRGSNVYSPNQLASVVREGGPLGGPGDGTWFLAGFGEDTPATVRMNVTSGADANPCLVTGVFEPEVLEAEILLFPNPATRDLNMTLQLPEGITEAEVRVSDIMGRVMFSHQVNGQTVNQNYNVDKLAAGTYFITVRADGKLITKRFAVAK